MEKITPLYEVHKSLHGKIVPFAGYLLPVQYEKGVIEEHMAVRTAAGLFDVSHMGEVLLRGEDALSNLQYILTNDFTNMTDGQARYSVICNEKGGCVDDVIVYRINENAYFIVVNAANKDKDYKWFSERCFGNASFEDLSDGISQIALQGPKSKEIICKLTDNLPEKYYHCIFDGNLGGVKCIISKTGYTGEDGYEIYMANEDATSVWEMLTKAGTEFGVMPCGLGARDTLRLEAAMPLYGHEMDDTVTPLETGLGFAVKMQKEDFIGKSALTGKGTPDVKRVGLKVVGRGIIREHEEIFIGDRKVGHTTSGTFCPYLGFAVAMALVDASLELGEHVEVLVRGRKVEAEIIALPFYKKNK